MENTEKKQPLVQVKNLCKYFEISRKETLKAVMILHLIFIKVRQSAW